MSLSATKGPFLRERAIRYIKIYETFLRRRIRLSLYFLRVRVFTPSAGLPHGVRGCALPIGQRPSPPPCGWSAAFITLPRTVGRRPSQRERPAFPRERFIASMLPT